MVRNYIQADHFSLNEIPDHLPRADIVISSTASPLPIIGKGMVETALKKRRHQPMLLVDIAVPRDVEAQVGELSDAYLYSVDDLQSIIDSNIEQRKVSDSSRSDRQRRKRGIYDVASFTSSGG